jgi:hypothetical protein
MSNAFLQDPTINKGQPITPTGFSKLNARVDAFEFSNERHLGQSPDALRIANVFQRELVFQRAGRLPHHDPEVDLPVTDVFAAFNGIERGSESQFRFVGLACNEAEHQNRNGPLGGHFAVYADGGNTIVCRSQLPISPGSFLKWRIPSSPGLPADENNCGRLLAEIVAHNPGETGLSSGIVHLARHRVLHAVAPHDSERDQMTLAATMYDSIQAIGYLSVLAYLQATSPQALSDAEKQRIAVVMGVLPDKEAGDSRTRDQAAKMQSLLPDTLFQMRYDKSKDKSIADQKNRPFKLEPLLTSNLSAQQKHIARTTADPFGRLLALFMKQMEEDFRTIIGFTNTGGFPGHNMDVVLRRI